MLIATLEMKFDMSRTDCVTYSIGTNAGATYSILGSRTVRCSFLLDVMLR